MRVAFVTPHQRQTSGGVLTIGQYAEHLAARGHDVTLAVARGELADVVGCRVMSTREAARQPAYDAVIYPADLPQRLSLSGRIRQRQFRPTPLPDGQRICYLQGFGTPGNPAVVANLRRCDPVIASARWLEHTASQAGCATAYVPYGLDRQLFRPADRSIGEVTVAMMTHTLDWKGTVDGVEAITQARERVAFTVELFGVDDPGFDGASFHGRLSRDEVAALLRRVDVFVCPSWEEGFGIPGLEAQACGAALVTTDTKGSRDYAVNRSSALVVPPRDVAQLAGTLAEIVSDGDLRERVRRGGIEVAQAWPSWKESADRFERVMVELLA